MAISGEATTQCPDCETPVETGDNYCRNCGMFVAMDRPLPAERPGVRAIQHRATNLPAPVKRAAAAVAVGAAIQVGASIAGKYLLRQAAQSLKPDFSGQKRSEKKARNLPAKAVNPAAPPDAPASFVSETLMIRRVWTRRDG